MTLQTVGVMSVTLPEWKNMPKFMPLSVQWSTLTLKLVSIVLHHVLTCPFLISIQRMGLSVVRL